MIKIAHRGNRNGPVPDSENDPAYLISAIAAGYHVEADIWYTNKGLYLGHDEPKHKVDLNFIEGVMDETWFHCKNLEAMHYLSKIDLPVKFFWHQNDDFTLTSNGYIWTYPGKDITDMSVLVDPDLRELDFDVDAYAVCSDYVEEL
jgi:hypothetical protein